MNTTPEALSTLTCQANEAGDKAIAWLGGFKPNFVQSSVDNEDSVNTAPVAMNPEGSFMDEIYEEVPKDQT